MRQVEKRQIPVSKGFTLIEVVAAIAIGSVFMSGLVLILDRMAHFRGTAMTMTQVKDIEAALEVTYRENVRHIEQNCYGWKDAACLTLTITPAGLGASNDILLVNTPSLTAVAAWTQAGCVLTGGPPNYSVTCLDKYGMNMTFTPANAAAANAYYTNGYAKTPFTLVITSGGNNNLTDTWSTGYLDSEYASASGRKLLTVAAALKTYHTSRLTHEVVVNSCDVVDGGLESYDDVVTPWYFQSAGTAAANACTGLESGNCGCSAFDTVTTWRSAASGWNRINTSAKFAVVFANLGLSNDYRVDGYGNPLELWFTVDGAGTLQSEPPRPRVNYDGVWAVKPPYVGRIGVYNTGTSAWLSYTPVMYPQ